MTGIIIVNFVLLLYSMTVVTASIDDCVVGPVFWPIFIRWYYWGNGDDRWLLWPLLLDDSDMAIIRDVSHLLFCCSDLLFDNDDTAR